MNYKKSFISLLLFGSFILLSKNSQSLNKTEKEEIKILITTAFGNITIKLYNETEIHRNNFVKLVKEHYFDSLLFHRVIQNFMIQGGDPDSKYAIANMELGNGGPPYTLPAEFRSNLFHKKGVLAAARDSDLENPSQQSAGSQFYIVQGRVFNDSLLKIQAIRITKLKLFNTIINRRENLELQKKYMALPKFQKNDSLKYLNGIITKIVEKELPVTKLHTFTEEQIRIYKTIGGTPHLDESYTVFGEVLEGFEVINNIATQMVDINSRPIADIRMKISILP